jgi:hypothetical protein
MGRRLVRYGVCADVRVPAGVVSEMLVSVCVLPMFVCVCQCMCVLCVCASVCVCMC